MKTLTTLTLSFILCFCGSGPSSEGMLNLMDGSYDYESAAYGTYADYDASEEVVTEVTPQDESQQSAQKKLTRKGSLTVEVKDAPGMKRTVDSLVVSSGAYYENEEQSGWASRSTYDLKIRIPNRNFDGFISALESGQGKIKSKKITADDMTMRYIDTETRLENKMRTLERYRQLLQKASTIKDILDIEEKVRVLEEEIDSAKATLKHIDSLVSYSILNVRIEEPYREGRTGFDFLGKMGDALTSGWHILLWLLIAATNIWPILLIACAAVFISRYYIKKKAPKRNI